MIPPNSSTKPARVNAVFFHGDAICRASLKASTANQAAQHTAARAARAARAVLAVRCIPNSPQKAISVCPGADVTGHRDSKLVKIEN